MDKVENTLVDLMECLALCEGINKDTQQDILILMARLGGDILVADQRSHPMNHEHHDHKEGDGVKWDGKSGYGNDWMNRMKSSAIKPKWEPGVDLPPKGARCELAHDRWAGGAFDAKEMPAGTEVLIGGHVSFGGADVAVFMTDDHRTGTAIADCFRPIRPHRDKVIEAAEQTFLRFASSKQIGEYKRRQILGGLYDDGFLKLPGEEE